MMKGPELETEDEMRMKALQQQIACFYGRPSEKKMLEQELRKVAAKVFRDKMSRKVQTSSRRNSTPLKRPTRSRPQLHTRNAELFAIDEKPLDKTSRGHSARIQDLSRRVEREAKKGRQNTFERRRNPVRHIDDESSDSSRMSSTAPPVYNVPQPQIPPYMPFMPNPYWNPQLQYQQALPQWTNWWQQNSNPANTSSNVSNVVISDDESDISNASEPYAKFSARVKSTKKPLKGILTSRTAAEEKKNIKRYKRNVRFQIEHHQFNKDLNDFKTELSTHSAPVTNTGNRRREEFLKRFSKKYKL